MSAFKTVCGFYCASVALVGVYFFIILAIMEFKGNTYLLQMVQNVAPDRTNGALPPQSEIDGMQYNTKTKGWAFMITAGVQVIIMAGCYFCAKGSMDGDAKIESDEIAKQSRAY